MRRERAETRQLLAKLLNTSATASGGDSNDTDNRDNTAEGVALGPLKPLTSFKGLVIGGHQNWHQKLKKVLPDLRIIHPDKATVDTDLIAEADFVVFHAGYANHRQFRTAIDFARQSGKRVSYVSHVNVGLFLQELCNDLHATY